jgi:hypothetical protein
MTTLNPYEPPATGGEANVVQALSGSSWLHGFWFLPCGTASGTLFGMMVAILLDWLLPSYYPATMPGNPNFSAAMRGLVAGALQGTLLCFLLSLMLYLGLLRYQACRTRMLVSGFVFAILVTLACGVIGFGVGIIASLIVPDYYRSISSGTGVAPWQVAAGLATSQGMMLSSLAGVVFYLKRVARGSMNKHDGNTIIVELNETSSNHDS